MSFPRLQSYLRYNDTRAMSLPKLQCFICSNDTRATSLPVWNAQYVIVLLEKCHTLSCSHPNLIMVLELCHPEL